MMLRTPKVASRLLNSNFWIILSELLQISEEHEEWTEMENDVFLY